MAERKGRLLMVQPTWPSAWTWDLPGGSVRRTLKERYLLSFAFTLRGEVDDKSDAGWAPPGDEIARVEGFVPSTVWREAIHWHHWDALPRLGDVPEVGS